MAFAAIAGPIAGAVVGGLMGGDGGGGSQTQSKEPWEPARKPLINSLNTGQDLERYYQQTPFNPLQQQGYQNLFADLDQFRSQLSPQLMQFANSMMQSDYQRGPRNSQAEAMGRPMQQQMPQQYQTKPMQMQGGLLAAPQSTMPQSGLLGAFQAPSAGNYGPLNFTEQNPFTSTTNGIPPARVAEKPTDKSPEDLAREEWERRRMSGEGYRGEGA